MITYQDFMADYANNPADGVHAVINDWLSSDLYKTAMLADLYDRQKNKTINEYVQNIFSLNGSPIEDFTASNAKICSNFFHRLNTQRCTYSLGNGVSFSADGVKEKFGSKFDTVLLNAGYHALIHAVSFIYFNGNTFEFPATEFAPIWDEDTGALKAGVRFWQLDAEKPMYAVLYEEDGFTKFRSDSGNSGFEPVTEKTSYILRVQSTPALGEEIIGGENYSALPIVPLWGTKLKQSTLIGMQQSIDSYDLVRSGFANDLSDCTQIFWILENYGGMEPEDLARFRDRLKITHIAEMNTMNGGKITPYSQEPPYAARKQFLDDMRAEIYENFGGLDVHTVAAGATNDHIDAAYQPMDENADDFEMQVIDCIQQLGVIVGISEEDATPLFKRNRISNQLEQVEMLTQEAAWLDEETILNKLPNITVDEVADILRRKDAEDMERMNNNPFVNQETEQEENTEEEQQQKEYSTV